jgi:D-alanine-D-alanine ligase
MSRVAVVMGGKSAEREVSLRTGAAMAQALRRLGYEALEVDAREDLARKLLDLRVEAALLALHGRWGEDGTVQGLLEIMEIPYTGSGVLASALAMDKGLSKVVFQAAGVPTPEFQLLQAGEAPVSLQLAPPLVAKPPREGSTIGVAIAREASEIAGAVAVARAHSADVLLERFVAGRELTLSVLDGEPLPLIEVIPASGFYDYEAKYTAGRTQYVCPAPVESREALEVVRVGVAAYRALGCSGAARVDLILDSAGRPWILEVNTIPGMTPTSLLPKAAAAAGIDFDELVQRMLAGASLKA